jgi:hypothetical protein
MKRFISTLASTIFIVALAGCASPSYYQAADNGKYFGYADRQVDGALHRINFIASPFASFDQTYAFTIYRAAELAQSKGATHFEVLEGPVNKDAIERFIGQTTAANVRAFDGKELDGINVAHSNMPRSGFVYGGSPLLMPVAAYQAPTYIYIPVQPPPPPVQISLLIRLLNAPSLEASKGFDVNVLLTRLAPKIIRPPIKTT